MAITYVVGDLLDLALKGEFNVIVHGCNCNCTMNSGVAKALRVVDLPTPEVWRGKSF